MAVVDALVRLKADTAQFSKAMADASKATDKVGFSADKTSALLGSKLKIGLLAAATAAATVGFAATAAAGRRRMLTAAMAAAAAAAVAAAKAAANFIASPAQLTRLFL